jgi:3'(2'), 5'-bisphosphate nucleotidase
VRLQEELSVAEDLARRAGYVLLKYYEEPGKVQRKAGGEPVTKADVASNDLIVQGLQRVFPHDAILSEEQADDRRRLQTPRVWMVDPLDGTNEYIQRLPEFSVMIGLVEEGVPVLGVVYQPLSDELYYAVEGSGAWLRVGSSRRRLQVSDIADPARMRLVVSRSHREPLVDAIKERLGIERERISGSVGVKVALIARGECDLYLHPSPHTRLWDVCAAQVLLQEAGGVMTDMRGDRIRYDLPEIHLRQGIAASNGSVHEKILAQVADLLKEKGGSQ